MMGIARAQTVIRNGDPFAAAGARLAGAAGRGAVVYRRALPAEWNLFDEIPTTPNSGDYTLGLQFSSSIPGTVISMRMWLAASDDVTFQIRNAGGTVVASATGSGGAAAWASAALSPPFSIQPSTTYWATGYGDNMGEGILYVENPGLPRIVGPLTVTQFAYASGLNVFPDSSFGDWYGPDLTFREGG